MMMINGIDFDKRLDHAKEINHRFIDCLGVIQNVMSSEPRFGAPLDYIFKAIGVVAAMEDFKSKIIPPHTGISPKGTIHCKESLMLKI